MSKVSNSESFSLSLHLELVEASHWTLHKRAAQVWQAASEQTSDQSCCLITQHPLLWRSLSRASTASSQGKWEQEFVSRSPWMKWTLYKKNTSPFLNVSAARRMIGQYDCPSHLQKLTHLFYIESDLWGLCCSENTDGVPCTCLLWANPIG